jgi:T-complex protein 1 subunit alpha
MKQGVSINVTDPTKLQSIKQREVDLILERISMILAAGANVVLTTGGIDDLCCKCFVEKGAMAIRRCRKEDLKRICNATGATLIMSLVNLEGEESFDPLSLGFCEEVSQVKISEEELILVKGSKNASTASIILRGATNQLLDEMDRSIHDALCAVKRTLESNAVVPGGGAVEASLSIYLENFAMTLGSREQLAIAQFAEALLIIPKTLAVNAAKDATDLVSTLRAHHNTAQKDESKKYLSHSGLDLKNGKVRNNTEAGVLEPSLGKRKCIQFATEAAITILRIDDTIKINPKPEPSRGEDY